jgi:hypothetical protein
LWVQKWTWMQLIVHYCFIVLFCSSRK